jgi:predicted 2-oxoglutarate/Fe(II)-dependent dioxygenase YbiX
LKEIGGMIMFKSSTRHMVTPVLDGERKNLTLFLDGPNFK